MKEELAAREQEALPALLPAPARSTRSKRRARPHVATRPGHAGGLRIYRRHDRSRWIATKGLAWKTQPGTRPPASASLSTALAPNVPWVSTRWRRCRPSEPSLQRLQLQSAGNSLEETMPNAGELQVTTRGARQRLIMDLMFGWSPACPQARCHPHHDNKTRVPASDRRFLTPARGSSKDVLPYSLLRWSNGGKSKPPRPLQSVLLAALAPAA